MFMQREISNTNIWRSCTGNANLLKNQDMSSSTG